MKNNLQLVQFAISKIGCGYVFGATGQIITEANIQQFAKDNAAIYSSEYIVRSRKWIGKESYDCAGIIDAFCGINTTANNYFAKALKKGNTMADMPKIPGVLVHMNGHVGIYVGNGDVVEARGVDYGVVKTKLNARPWVRWSYCYLINYVEETVSTPEIGSVPNISATHSIGEDVIYSSCYTSSDSVEPIIKDGHGKITKIIPGARQPYLIGNGICWVNDGDIRGAYLGDSNTTRPINPYTEPMVSLYKGKTGMKVNDIKWLQFELNWRYPAVKIDGKFGDQTNTYLGEFQDKMGLGKDFKCGPLTRQSLKTKNK